MDPKFFNYYTELLNRTVQELFNKSLVLQTNQKIHEEEIASLRKQVEEFKNARNEDEKEALITRLSNENEGLKLENQKLILNQSNADTYRDELLKAQERIKELEQSTE